MRRAVCSVTSLTMRSSQPKFEAGASSQACTSPPASSDGGAIATPVWGVVIVKLGVASKSPPGVVQNDDGKNVCSHVASPACAGAPVPPVATDAPSPQARLTRCPVTASGTAAEELTTLS